METHLAPHTDMTSRTLPTHSIWQAHCGTPPPPPLLPTPPDLLSPPSKHLPCLLLQLACTLTLVFICLMLQLSMSHASDQLWSLAHSISHQSHSSEHGGAAHSAQAAGITRRSSGGSKASSPTGPEASTLPVLPRRCTSASLSLCQVVPCLVLPDTQGTL